MKVVLLAGGFGTRISEESHLAMVDSRWAMTSSVLPRTSLPSADWMTASFSGSV